jgi:hypothetical protein
MAAFNRARYLTAINPPIRAVHLLGKLSAIPTFHRDNREE